MFNKTERKSFVKKVLFRSLIVFSILAALVSSRLLYLHFQGNFHPVSENKIYRSAQLDKYLFGKYIKSYGIKTIINLRGKRDHKKWYRDELAVSKKYNVKHYDLNFSSTEKPTDANIKKLLQLYNTAEKPILVHCQGGADRAGIASAIWELVMENKKLEDAADQLSLRYGHMPVGPTQTLDKYLENFQYSKYQ